MNDKLTKRIVLIIATLSSFMTPFMASSINVALPAIAEEFQIDAILLSWVATSYLLAAAIFLVPFGKLSDIYGRKKTFSYGIMIFTVSSFLSAISTSVLMLILFRILQGIGSAMIFATGLAILTSVFPHGERGKALGIAVCAVYIGLSSGPFLGGFMTHHFSWRSIFLINIPFGLSIVSLILWKLKQEWAEAKGEKFDIAGSLLYAFSLMAVMYGVSLLPDVISIGFILFGLMGIWAFVKWEIRVDHPVFEVNLFITNRVFALSNLAALINYSATFAITFLLSLYLQYIKGLSPQSAGIILISQPLMMAVLSPYAGNLSDKIEPRVIASSGMALTAIGLFLFTFLGKNTPLPLIVMNLLLLGLGFALFSSPNMNAIMSSVEKKFYGIASGSVGTMRLLGQMFSMGIATLIFALYIGRVQITVENYPVFTRSLKVAFGVFSVLSLIGICASLTRGNLRQDLTEEQEVTPE